MRRLARVLIGGTVLALLAGWGVTMWAPRGTGPAPAPEASADTLGDYGPVPEFSLIERSGRRVTLTDLRGTVWVTSFIYTECTEACPLQSLQMGRLQEDFAGSPDLRLVSITVDPEHDTPKVLARYAERYRADPRRWLFLTGPKGAIYALAKTGFKLGVQDASPSARLPAALSIFGPTPAFASHGSKGLILHSSRFVLVDRQGRIRAYHRTDDPESLARLRENLRVLLGQS
jgi:cytochrome oxidase Cu insertion factor (SCO1/SenC/PrrC family)